MHKFVRLVESLRAGVSEPGAWRIRERKVEVRDVQCPDPLMPGTVTQNFDAGRTGAAQGPTTRTKMISLIFWSCNNAWFLLHTSIY